MAEFSQYAREYFESGLCVLPCNKKRPLVGSDWQKYCEGISEDRFNLWEDTFDYAYQIGLCLGGKAGIVAFDFDYEYNDKVTIKKSEFEKDKKFLEQAIISLLPETTCIKIGKKGWTRFYRSNVQLPNMMCDRYGVRLFDFLADRKQTIIPPSKYDEDGNLKYRWVGESIADEYESLPTISIDTVKSIKNLYGESQGVDESRHGKLFRWACQASRVQPDKEKVARDMVEYDKRINEPAYLSDLKHNQSKDAYKNALKWLDRIYRYNETAKEHGKSEQVTHEGWDYFFDNSFVYVKKDIITKNVYIKVDKKDQWTPIDNLENVLRSYAQKSGLNKSNTRDELDRWSFEKKECDYLCDVPKWDGVDRIHEFAKCIVSKDYDLQDIESILKHWGSNIFRRVENPRHQNRCILLKGGQGFGKDTLVAEMLKDFVPYYELSTLAGTQKDVLEIVSRLLVCHIEEFDQTKHLDVAFIKSLISQPSAFFRESYARTPNQKIMRTSFISTANVDDILRDPTGNRRFIVIPLEALKWEYPQGQSIQIVAQFRHYAEENKYSFLSKNTEDKIKEVLNLYTPEDTSVAVIEIYKARYRAIVGLDLPSLAAEINAPFRGHQFLTYSQASDMLNSVAKSCNVSQKRVLSILKHAGLSHKFRDGVKYFGTSEDRLNWISQI